MCGNRNADLNRFHVFVRGGELWPANARKSLKHSAADLEQRVMGRTLLVTSVNGLNLVAMPREQGREYLSIERHHMFTTVAECSDGAAARIRQAEGIWRGQHE